MVVGNSVVAVVGSHPAGNLLEGDSPVVLEVAVAPLASAVDHLAFAVASAFDIVASFGSIGNTVVGSMGDTKKIYSTQLKDICKRNWKIFKTLETKQQWYLAYNLKMQLKTMSMYHLTGQPSTGPI